MTSRVCSPDVIVVGAGVIGLTTAWRLRDRGASVEIWSREDSLATTSALAGAIWYPFLAEPRDRVLAWSKATYHRLAELCDDPASGVHMESAIEVFAEEQPDLWWRDAAPHIEPVPAAEVPPPHRAAIRVRAPVCDVPVYLPWLRQQVEARGVTFVTRAVASFDECFARAPTVVNCAGLGAAELCDDDQLVPVRGQLLHSERLDLPHAWIDDTTPVPSYIVPRRDGLVLGGTAQHGDRSLEPRDADRDAILQTLHGAFPQLADAEIRHSSVGLRPFRSTVRLELEPPTPGRNPHHRLIHNYGHGGSGYTLAWGCANEVAAY